MSAGDLVSIPGLGRKIMDLNLVFSESRENLLLKLIMTIEDFKELLCGFYLLIFTMLEIKTEKLKTTSILLAVRVMI